MNKSTKELFSMLKNMKYEYSKDVFGFYFTKGENKFSCIKNGTMYSCYHNRLIDKQWVLQSKTYQLFDLDNSLLWIIRAIQSMGSV